MPWSFEKLQLTKKKISADKGRSILMLIIIGSAILAHLILIYESRDGRIHPEGIKSTIHCFLGLYLPLIAAMSVFYFTEKKNNKGKRFVNLQTFIFALIVTTAWVLLPILFLISGFTVEKIQDLLQAFRPFGDTVAVVAVVFFFLQT